MAKLQPVRGTHDLLPEDARRHRHIIDTALGTSERYGFGEIQTPIFEFTEVFKRTLGESSDVVSKEMYTFADNGGEEITLRPEGTASVARALISGGLSQSLPLKFFYQGPMFRYERPQKGRQRQFHQIGIELLGVAEPQADIEILTCGADILDTLGILEHTTLELNTLGDIESRKAYRAALVAYFSDHLDALSEDSRRRLEVNPLRILDSKNEGDRKLVANAPAFDDHLNAYSKEFFAQVTAGLDALEIPWTRNPHLVRGLDYYCHTAFEFTTTLLGSQGTVMGGGRYDGLVETMGGPTIPGVGWAAGIERLAMLGQELGTVTGDAPRPIAIVPMGAETDRQALTLAHRLRKSGFLIEHGYSGNIGKRLKRASKVGARAAIILGGDELARGAVQLRDLDAGDQSEVLLTGIEEQLARFR
jgi:histidyl-tRNA synthetase